MKKLLLILFSVVFIAACSSVKRSQKALNSGNYIEAIDIAVDRLQKDKTKKGNREHIAILEQAFKKGTEDANSRIAFLKKENNPVNTREIYDLYSALVYMQSRIQPLLPLYHGESGKQAKFKFVDYSDELIASKQNYAAYLYDLADMQMQRNSKTEYRNAHNTLKQLQRLYTNYKDVNRKLEDAHYYGTDFVFVQLTNRSNVIMPMMLQRELLDFNTYGLDDFWTVYHSQMDRNIDYDFGIDLTFRNISIAPERITQRIIPLEAEIKDGFSYQIDRRGNFVLDSVGNRIKIDRYVTVKGTLEETLQSKAIAVQGRVDYRDLKNNSILNNFPLQTEFIFENVFARFEGDRRVLSYDDAQLLRNRLMPFPSNEQMLLDAGQDIKGRLSEILSRNKLR